MKINFRLPALFLVLLGCSDGEDLQPMELRQPSVMNVYCLSAPDVLLTRTLYEYDKGNLTAETIFNNGEIYSQTTYVYDSRDQLLTETYLTSGLRLEKTFVYNELGHLVNIHHKRTDYDLNGQVVSESESEAPREYENNQLVREWESWGGLNTYEYENGKVVTKTDYNGLGEKHHITTYEYSGNLLVKEQKVTRDGALLYLKNYHYDAQHRLVTIREGENIIEENDYQRDQLVEKRVYYLGIDPGYSACNGNFIYRYGY
jgi:antitoxin component YwqK of YwqJK toxin-antitoxin module